MAKNKHKNQGRAYSAGGLTQPPPFTYDPAIEAERRASQRGLSDLLQDLARQRRYARQDFGTTKKDYRRELKRGTQDYSRDLKRGLQNIGQKRSDVALRQQRGTEDFTADLQNLTRRFNVLGNQQTQQANAAGTLGGGVAGAAAARRAENFQVARSPIDTAQARLNQDTQTDLSRLGLDETRLQEDINRGQTRLGQDIHHDKRLARRDYRRDRKDIRIEGQRGRREQAISDLDLLRSEIFDARERNPGAFSQTGQRRKKGRKR